MNRTAKIAVAGLVCLLLAWSYFARPMYDFMWIAAGRLWDKTQARYRHPYLRRDMRETVDAVTTQAAQIDQYLRTQRSLDAKAASAASFDYSSLPAYVHSTDALREKLRQSLSYPPPGAESVTAPAQETPLGEDDLAVYTRLRIPSLPGVDANGVYMVPKKHAPGKLPLVIAAHGRGGMPVPEADGKSGVVTRSNRDLAQGALERGYAVWEPSYIFYAAGQPEDIRDRLDLRAREVGTTLPAIEIAETVRALAVLAQRPEIDGARVAMVGVSYGGFYTLYTTALEPRIKVAVAAAYLNERASVLDSSEPGGFTDWRFPNSLGVLRDPAVVALVCPRPLEIQAGSQDQLFPIEGARRIAPEAAEYYQRLGVGDRFQFLEFTGRHDFNGDEAWKFLDRHL